MTGPGYRSDIRSTHPSRPSLVPAGYRAHAPLRETSSANEKRAPSPAGGTVAGVLEEVVPFLVRHLRVVEPKRLHLRRARHVGGLDPLGEIDLLVPSEVAAGDLGQPVEEGLVERLLCSVLDLSVVDEPRTASRSELRSRATTSEDTRKGERVQSTIGVNLGGWRERGTTRRTIGVVLRPIPPGPRSVSGCSRSPMTAPSLGGRRQEEINSVCAAVMVLAVLALERRQRLRSRRER